MEIILTATRKAFQQVNEDKKKVEIHVKRLTAANQQLLSDKERLTDENKRLQAQLQMAVGGAVERERERVAAPTLSGSDFVGGVPPAAAFVAVPPAVPPAAPPVVAPSAPIGGPVGGNPTSPIDRSIGGPVGSGDHGHTGANHIREWTGADKTGQGDEVFQLVKRIQTHQQPVHAVSMIDTAKAGSLVMATGSWDTTVQLYDLAKQKPVRMLGTTEEGDSPSKMGGLYAIAFSKTDEAIMGCTSCDKSVYLWNWRSGEKISKLTSHQDEVNGIDFHSSQSVMCTSSDDCKVVIWDFVEGIVLRTLDKHDKEVYGATFLGDEFQYSVATCCFDQKARIFDMRDKQLAAVMSGHTDDVIGIDYNAKAKFLATGSDDGFIKLWDPRKSWRCATTINTRETPELKENEVKRVKFSPNGKYLAAACSFGGVLVYEIEEPKNPPHLLVGHTDCVFDVAWGVLHGQDVLVSASHDKSSLFWKANTRSS